jgi:hypothetical protein
MTLTVSQMIRWIDGYMIMIMNGIGGMDDRSYGHGEHLNTIRSYEWLTRRSGDPWLVYGEEKEIAAFAERKRQAAAAARGDHA